MHVEPRRRTGPYVGAVGVSGVVYEVLTLGFVGYVVRDVTTRLRRRRRWARRLARVLDQDRPPT